MDEGNHMSVIKPDNSPHDVKVEGDQIYICLYLDPYCLNSSNLFIVWLCFFLFLC